ncbi:MAG: 16S rRNA (cytosine(1402)-N(4))-methyltransferase RsmH [Chloroflexota bacterium]|jgi:16S rRNA (cytosine1402-N4)-methyltransferase
MNDFDHIPVLLAEVVQLLQPQPGALFIDGTVGAGGHAAAVLEATAPNGRLLALDKDAEAVTFARQQLDAFADRVTLIQASYVEMGRLAPAHGFAAVDGILLDLGLSSRQLDDSRRGFSFMREGPLDMRFDTTQGPTAADLLNNLSAEELADIFWRYGEERHSRRLARSIVAHRQAQGAFTTTTQLAEFIEGQSGRRQRTHPATRIFQALRIAVNDELAAVEQGVETAVSLLKAGGRLAVISFHSLEDRFVKHYFRQQSQDCICPPAQPVCTCQAQATLRLVTRKVVVAAPEEVAANPRSRSARLRVAERIRETS